VRLFAIGDLHLSFAVEKKMDLFPGWKNYEEKLEKNWRMDIKKQDWVVLAGDTSWGMNFAECLQDFQFIHALPGKKLIMKGNHDYWWASIKKNKAFWSDYGLNSLDLLRNNAFLFGEIGICGTKGWICGPMATEGDQKIIRRESLRLETSIKAGLELGANELIVFLHYPPLGKEHGNDILNVLHKYKSIITACYYGHLHGDAIDTAFNGVYDDILFRLISADNLNFAPLLITAI
jgi:predicted phosphohydrolase